MNKNIFQPLKITALVLVLSVGISYVSAWTAPAVTPPGGNVSAPINVSVNSQTKAGDLKADTLYAYSFKDQNNPAYYLDPTVDSVLANIYATKICFGSTDCKTAWPAGGVTSVNGQTGAVTVGGGIITQSQLASTFSGRQTVAYNRGVSGLYFKITSSGAVQQCYPPSGCVTLAGTTNIFANGSTSGYGYILFDSVPGSVAYVLSPAGLQLSYNTGEPSSYVIEMHAWQ